MSEIEDAVKETLEKKDEWPLNAWIAGMVAITATFMAVGNIKDGNIVQAMALVQTKSVDAWSYYQAKSTKQVLTENTAEQLRTFLDVTPSMAATARAGIEKRIAKLNSEAKRYGTEKEDIRKQAEGYEKEYERLNVHDDQFDMAEACLTVAIALMGVTALTRKSWLFFFGLTFAFSGVALELAGFLQWSFHPEWLAKLLG